MLFDFSRWLKVIHFCTNRKSVYDFPSVINCDLSSTAWSPRHSAAKGVEKHTHLSLRKSRKPFRISSLNLNAHILLFFNETAWSYNVSRFVTIHLHHRRQTDRQHNHDNSQTLLCNCNARLKSVNDCTMYIILTDLCDNLRADSTVGGLYTVKALLDT